MPEVTVKTVCGGYSDFPVEKLLEQLEEAGLAGKTAG